MTKILCTPPSFMWHSIKLQSQTLEFNPSCLLSLLSDFSINGSQSLKNSTQYMTNLTSRKAWDKIEKQCIISVLLFPCPSSFFLHFPLKLQTKIDPESGFCLHRDWLRVMRVTDVQRVIRMYLMCLTDIFIAPNSWIKAESRKKN